jgi:hypothetical protein
MFHVPEPLLLFDVRTAEKKLEVSSYVPAPPAHLFDHPEPIPEPDPEASDTIRALARVKHEHYEVPELLGPEHHEDPGIENGIPYPPKKSRNKISLAQKQLLKRLWASYNRTRSPYWYAGQTGIRILTMYKLISKMQKGFDVAQPPRRRGRKLKRDDMFANKFCRNHLKEHPTSTLRELEGLLRETEHSLSRSTLDRMLTVSSPQVVDFPLWSFKRLSLRGSTANTPENKQARKKFVLDLYTSYEHGKFVIYLDETAWCTQRVRNWGWGKKGQKALAMIPPVSTTFTAIVAISQNGVHHSEMFMGTVNAALFESYL